MGSSDASRLDSTGRAEALHYDKEVAVKVEMQPGDARISKTSAMGPSLA